MKLTKIASMVMTSATVLSTVAAATPAVTQAKSQEGIAAGNKFNNGRTLPDNGRSRVGITFGKSNPDNPNKPDDGKGSNTDPGDGDHNGDGTLKPIGFLRLQHVPEVLDFGSHTKFDPTYPVFTAAGTNLNNTTNDNTNNDNTNKGYAGAANQTPKLSPTDTDLVNVNGKTWVTVVDKQETRHDTDAKNDVHPGDWQLSVKADGPLTTGKDANAKTIAGATLAFNNTATGHTANIFALTGNEADKGFGIAQTWLADNVIRYLEVNLAADGTAVQVATAKAGFGSGAQVFAWDPSDIKLTLPANASVDAGTYTTSLTWTLSTGIQ